MCSADVPEGVCSEIGSQAWRQTVLQTLRQHPAVSQSRPFDEGSHQFCTVLFAIFSHYQILVYIYICESQTFNDGLPQLQFSNVSPSNFSSMIKPKSPPPPKKNVLLTFPEYKHVKI